MNWKRAFAAVLSVAAIDMAPAHSAETHVGQAGEVTNAMAFLTALGSLNFDAANLFLDEDVVLDLPFAGKGVTVKGRSDVLQFLQKSMAGSIGMIQYRLDRAYPSPEAGAVVLEISTRGRRATGQEYSNRLVAIFEFRRGKIRLFREYFNPSPISG